jgi:tetratricopeptide (TPR) repeat protein
LAHLFFSLGVPTSLDAKCRCHQDDAARLYRRALDAARRLGVIEPLVLGETWTALGDVLEQAGRPQEALDAYRRASAMVRDDLLLTVQLLLKRARVRERSGAFVAALRDVTRAERLLASTRSATASSLRATAASLRATVHAGQEQPRRALAAAERAVRQATEAGELREVARALSVLDWAHLELGSIDQAVHEERVAEIYESLGEPHRAAAALGNQGAVHYWQGRWDDALRCYLAAHQAYELTGDVINAATQQANVGELLLDRGQVADARPTIVEAARTHRAVGFVDGALFDEIQLGRLLLAEGDHAEAERVLDAVVQEAGSLGLRTTELQAAVHLAAVRLDAGRATGAIALLAAAERAAGSDAALLGASVELVRGLAFRAAGDEGSARRAIEDGVRVARELGLRYELGLLLTAHHGEAERQEGRALLAELGVPVDQLLSV